MVEDSAALASPSHHDHRHASDPPRNPPHPHHGDRGPTHHGHDHHGQDHAHDHDHDHDHRGTPASRLAVALVLTILFMFAEAAAGWFSGSLALVADAGHMLSDSAALALALIAQRIAQRPRSSTRTFGSRRAEVLAAFINGIALAVTAVLIVHEAIGRLLEPRTIAGPIMLVTAVLGLVVNIVAAFVLRPGGHDNPNTRAAFMHVISDALGSVGAIAAGVVVIWLGWYRADPIIGMLIAALILWGAWRLVKETTSVLMEGTPDHVDVVALENTIRSVPGVRDVHDLHAWTISDGFHAVTAHVVLRGNRHGTEVVEETARAIRDKHGIDHVTLQPEAPPPGLVQIRVVRGNGSELDDDADPQEKR